MRFNKLYIPWLMTAARAALGPVLILGERCRWSGFGLAALVAAALLSDIFDGVLARRWHGDTATVRLFDSMADTIFYACAAVALFTGQHTLWTEWRNSLLLLAGAEAVNIAFNVAKFGKPASYHSYLAKTWGLVLAATLMAVYATGHATLLFPLSIALGVASNLEGVAMSLMLPVWRKDVKTLAAAWRLRGVLLRRAANEIRFASNVRA